MFLEAEVQVLLLICILMKCQYLFWIGPYLVLSVNFGKYYIEKEFSSLIKLALNE